MNKKVIIALGIFIGIILIIVIAQIISNNSTPDQGVIKDRDTGNTALVGHTGDPSGRALVVFGESNLYEKGVSKEQFQNLQETLSQYAKDRLNSDIQSVTVRPQDLIKDGAIITSTLRIGQTETLLPLSIKFDGKDGTSILIKDPENKYKGTYVGVSGLPYSGLSSIAVDPVSDTISSINDPITLSVVASEGYRNGAVNKINELDHTIGNFKYVFTNYESPF